ncbi:DNA mismatch repair endonuclease MutL [Oscillatoria laete-virens NRMC-F 0139]|nr:DNA mismatch repair endonuclease MutL [Oscillatoria laete-virens]MDL5055136.1 DNA mismatch repair endonuclease MutL [Oscillatoria laete-virens NRMC-F 0139]
MGRINILSEVVANQIAAGEVVERPASVLKELIENSLDAGAKRLLIEVKSGGRSLIRVQDDGCGMDRDDALLCLERHATSKIKAASDLLDIASFGFRGEAVPSIASVSRFRLATCAYGEAEGTEIQVEGGKISSVTTHGRAPGTDIEIRSLFYNVPARKKIPQSENTETAHIQQVILYQALAHADTAFTYIQDGKTVWQLASTGNLLERIRQLKGMDFCRELLAVDHASHGLKITGFIGKPGVSRGSRAEQVVFVNRRPVDSRAVNFALLEGYHNALMKGRYPVAILFIQMDPALVDVNVHPSKKEVRFRDEPAIREAVVEAVRSTLLAGQSHASPASPASAPPNFPFSAPRPKFSGVSPAQSAAAMQAFAPLAPEQIARKESARGEEDLPALRNEPASGAPPVRTEWEIVKKEEASPGPQGVFRMIGILNKTYILAESVDGLVLIDQHAAHERIMFEKLLGQFARAQVESQQLLAPETVHLEPRDAAVIEEHLEELNRTGIGISAFGQNTFMVDALPVWLGQRSARDIVRDLVDSLSREGGKTARERRYREEKVVRAACRASVKANDFLTLTEIERLLRDLLACELPYTCPHGRPTMILMTHSELEKKFGRIQP